MSRSGTFPVFETSCFECAGVYVTRPDRILNAPHVPAHRGNRAVRDTRTWSGSTGWKTFSKAAGAVGETRET